MAAEAMDEFICRCNPCVCDEPPPLASDEINEGACKCDEEPCECGSKTKVPEKTPSSENFASRNYRLNEFMRAKQLLKQMSTKTGISLYDHLGEVIVKALDFYAPSRALNFVEEISLNVKRYRFQENKDNLNECFYMSKNIVNDASMMVGNWQQHVEWSMSQQELPEGEKKLMTGFPSFQRFMSHLEQVNVALQREEAFRISLAIRQFYMSRPFVDRVRFFGKIFGSQKHYYILEVETRNKKAVAEDIWVPKASTTTRYFKKIKKMAEEPSGTEQVAEDDITENLPGAGDTFERAGKAVTDPDILLAYQTTSGLPADTRNTPAITTYTTSFNTNKTNEGTGNKETEQVTGMVAAAMDALNFTFDDPDALAEQVKWEGYQADLMSDFPAATTEEETEIPPELEGNGINRRYFYVCNVIGGKWNLLPPVTPQQINHSRTNRWHLTGNLNARVKTHPKFPGREGHYLRALLSRITAGAQVSPKGYFQLSKGTRQYNDEEDDDDEELGEGEEELREEGDDSVYPSMRFESPKIISLLDPSLELWCHHTGYVLPQGRFVWWNPVQPSEKKRLMGEDEDDSDYDDEDEGEDSDSKKEIGPMLFQSLVEDQSHLVKAAWTARASLTIFADFQLVGVQSNIWPGATAICTAKGKSENVYIGDGLKLLGRCFAPIVPPACQTEYASDGPELKEFVDPTVEQEQNWLSKLQLLEIADVEEAFVDNENPGGAHYN